MPDYKVPSPAWPAKPPQYLTKHYKKRRPLGGLKKPKGRSGLGITVKQWVARAAAAMKRN